MMEKKARYSAVGGTEMDQTHLMRDGIQLTVVD